MKVWAWAGFERQVWRGAGAGDYRYIPDRGAAARDISRGSSTLSQPSLRRPLFAFDLTAGRDYRASRADLNVSGGLSLGP